ncbi:hypothetical protein [Streptomyces sp. NBC_00503]|uniref:hypothetical protein n=1 Tax=Streptomyces sp. NBC_00503 TaxID=2903659 RepID=UPI002E82325C|nr:hypothetical protein [Streptomyces sp. NBC_00503]WUD79581.1 hypothetical protein OG490_02750 [Streptomyces sp. NBC_00503]
MGKNDNHEDSGGPTVSEEDWARFMEDAASGAGEAPKEPSARARMVTERLRREEEQRAKAAKKRRGRAPAEPPGWRTGPAWQEMQGRGKTKRRLKATAAIVFVAALALIAIRPELVIDKVTGKAAQDAKSRQPLPAETVAPTSAPSVVYPDQPTLREPFKGSPAVQWADGAAGIEVPEAQAVGAVSKDKVAATLEKAKQFLVAANLDRATLSGARPTAALALLDPKMDEYMADVEEGLSHPSEKKDPLTLFSRVDPAQLKLVGDVVKVRGRMWAEAGSKAGQVEVKADYTFVYPLVKAKPGSEQVARTIVRREITFSIVDPRKWETTAGTLWVAATNRSIGNSACELNDGFFHPRFDDDAPTGPTPSGTPVDPYDRTGTLADGTATGCGALSRS